MYMFALILCIKREPCTSLQHFVPEIIWTMSRLWQCVLLWCPCWLLIFLEIVTAQSTCLRSGDCLSGFYCHTGNGFCVSCDKCSDARGNLRLCEKECFPVTTHASPNPEVRIEHPSTSNKPMIVAIAVTITTVFLVAVTVAVIFWYRRCRAKVNMGTCIPETGELPSRMDPTATLPLTPECALPDEHLSLLQPIINAEQ